MIQRVQTIWLFLSGFILLGLFVFPYVNQIDLVSLGRKIYVSGIYTSVNNENVRQEAFTLQMIVTTILAIFPLFIIFRYKNRKQQLVLVYTQIVLIILLTVWMYVTGSSVLSTNNQFIRADNVGVGLFIPPISILFLALAISGIRRDEKLIKSADRLR